MLFFTSVFFCETSLDVASLVYRTILQRFLLDLYRSFEALQFWMPFR